MDKIDFELLALLQQNGRLSNADLARAVGLSQAGVHKRLRRLDEAGYFRRFTVLLDISGLGFDLLCFARIKLTPNTASTYQKVQAHLESVPEVLEAHEVTGDEDVLLKLVARSRKHLRDVLNRVTNGLPEVTSISTTISIQELKEYNGLPLEEPS
jgi:Lrp/AsnC family leucine-responsive transcriptional regulator